MLNLDKLIASFRECLGWPYKSPGTNDRNGIDCSGMFVRAYRAQGASIYHGSNSIWRRYTAEKGVVTSGARLRRGMAVFKWRSKDTPKFPDGQGDFYHIGLVVQENPVRIVHASTNGRKVREDPWSSSWSRWAYLKDVDYGAQEPQEPQEDNAMTVWVHTENGGPVNLRRSKSTSSSLKARIPNGTPLEVLDSSDVSWYQVRYEGITGWVMAEYLSHTPPGAPQPTYRVRIEGVTWQQYRRILDICPLAEAEIEEG